MKALDGIKVLDFTHAISGPTCTQALRQLGAEVIKIEPPRKGDDFRHYTEHAGLPNMSVPFAAVNAGKKSVTLDLKSQEGKDIARRLAREMLVDVPIDGDDAPLRQLGLPFRFSETRRVPPRPAGPAGADTAAIRREIGLGQDEIAALAASGAFEGKDRK